MSEILRVLSYDEFIAEYGQIKVYNEVHLITENGIKILLSRHLKAAFENELISLEYSSLKHFYYVLSSDVVYDENGMSSKEKIWYIYILSNILN